MTWFPDCLRPTPGFNVTDLNWAPRKVTHFHGQRGTAEQWINEGKYASNWTRLSCQGFAENQVRLKFFAAAFNLGRFLLRLALRPSIRHWFLRTLQVRLIKIGAKVIRHAGCACARLAEVSVPRQPFLAISTPIRWLLEPVMTRERHSSIKDFSLGHRRCPQGTAWSWHLDFQV